MLEVIILFFFLISLCASLIVSVILMDEGGSANASGGPMTDMGTEISALNASGRIPPGVIKEGKKAFETVLRRGIIHGEGSNTRIDMRPSQFFPSESCRVRYKIWFDDAFDWEETSGRKVAGKLGGFNIGTGASSSGSYSNDGSTFRLVYKPNQGAAGYFYPAVSSGKGSSWADLDQDSSLVDQSYIAMGVHVWYIGRRAQFTFKKGAWNDIEMFCKLNTPGKKDGIMELVVNGTRRRLDRVRYRNNDIKIEKFHLNVFAGGGSDSYAPTKDVRIWFADFGFGSS